MRPPILIKSRSIQKNAEVGLALPSHVTRRQFEYQMQGSFRRYSSFGHEKTRPGGIWRDGFEELNWVRAVRSDSPSWRAPYAVSPGRYSATAGSALWSLRISFQLLREFSVCRRPTRIA